MRNKVLTAVLFGVLLFGWIVMQGATARQTKPGIPIYTTEFTLRRAGEVQLDLAAAAPGCDWAKKDAEAAVVTVYMDDTPNQEIVLYRGSESAVYPVFLGPLNAGKHTLRVEFRPDLSAKQAQPAVVKDAKVTLRDTSDEEKMVWAHAPLLYGRPENNRSDVPLLCYYERTETPDEWRISYTLIWSNEDGGTNTPSLLARWGRTTDIEWLYSVHLSKATGEITKATYQGFAHQTLGFMGERRGKHPLLKTVTANNMVADRGESPLLFAVAPLRTLNPEKEPREAVMDAFPWSYTVAAKEMEREGKWETPGNAETLEPSDIRNYLHVGYRASVENARLAVEVRLKNGMVCSSDHGRTANAIDRSGWIRTTVELPPGTTAADIAGVTFVRRDNNETGSATVTAANAFLLQEDYRPAKPFLNWSGQGRVTVGKPFAPK
ncbi:MAG: hypothetical protein OHK0029_42020 [Armatimonadaceae bacterium]